MKNKKIIASRIFLLAGVLLLPFFVNAQTQGQVEFEKTLENMGISVKEINKKNTISRYELARILNAVECKDCITPKIDMVVDFNEMFWNKFSVGKDFQDISYNTAITKNTNYYYCVAYVGNNEYMRGYPAQTSPVCAGQFCGTRNTTKAEFLEIVVNLTAKYIYRYINVNRSQIESWVKKLDENSYATKTLTVDDKKIISENAKVCKENTCPLGNSSQVKTYLKYCMFNLKACDMREFGRAKEGIWPVAELNLLSKQEIIAVEEAEKYDIDKMIEGKKVISMLSNIFNLVGCSVDDDYDCDGIKNAEDVCQNTYNPNQRDLDNDKIPDVCDDDLDNDGIKNPIGIVDDEGNINIRLIERNDGKIVFKNMKGAYQDFDNCLFLVNTDQKDTNKDLIGDTCEKQNQYLGMTILVKDFQGTAPLTVSMVVRAQGPLAGVVWDFGDGSQGSGQVVSHVYQNPGIYTVKAIGLGGANEAIAKTTVVVGMSEKDKKAVQPLLAVPGGKIPFEASFAISLVGSADQVVWQIDDEQIIKKPGEGFKKIWNTPGTHQVSIKVLENNEIQAASVFTIGIGSGVKGTLLKSSSINPNQNENVTFTTLYNDKNLEKEIDYITWDLGDGIIKKTTESSLTNTYKYPGKKAIVQTIVFKDGTKITNLITLYVVDPTLFYSYATEYNPSKLIANISESIDMTIRTVGGKTPPILLGVVKDGQGGIQKKQSNELKKFPIQRKTIYSKSNVSYPEISMPINQCVSLQSQATIAISKIDMCLDAIAKNQLQQFKCDMDKDGIPDVCDDDIDGDGIKNLLGIISQENSNCSIKNQGNNNGTNTNNDAGAINNVNEYILNEHFQGSCALDNAPFGVNPDQADNNNDGKGDKGNDMLSGGDIADGGLLSDKDSDFDGINDLQDLCVDIPETYNTIDDEDGCPEIGLETQCDGIVPSAISDDGFLDVDGFPDTLQVTITPCMQCPCPYTDKAGALTNGDSIKAVLRNWKKSIPYSYSEPWLVE